MVKVYCFLCNKRCKGNVLKVDELFVHKACFLCSVCKTGLERGGFYQRDKKFFCREDYLNAFGSRCEQCHDIVEGEVVTMLGKTFHPHCFCCTRCKRQFLAGDKATLLSGSYYCTMCIRGRKAASANLEKREQQLSQTVNRPVTMVATNATASSNGDLAHPSLNSQTAGNGPQATAPGNKNDPNASSGEPLAHSATPSDSRQQNINDEERIMSNSAYASPRQQHYVIPHQSRRRNQSADPSLRHSLEHSAANTSGLETPLHPLYQHSYLYREMEVDATSGIVGKDRYHRSRSGYCTPSQQPCIRSRSPSPIHFHRPPGEPFSYRKTPKYIAEMRRGSGSSRCPTTQSPYNRVHFSTNGTEINNSQNQSSKSNSLPPNFNISMVNENREEVRRLASYPGGHPTSETHPRPVERSDWPAPPLTASINLEKRVYSPHYDGAQPETVTILSSESRSMSNQTILWTPTCSSVGLIGHTVVNRITDSMVQSLTLSTSGISSSESQHFTPSEHKDEDATSRYSCHDSTGAPIKSILVKHCHSQGCAPASSTSWQRRESDRSTHPNSNHSQQVTKSPDDDALTLREYLSEGVSGRRDSARTAATTHTLYCPPNVQDWLRYTGGGSTLYLNYTYSRQQPLPHRTLSYEVLCSASARPKGLDQDNLEAHLSDQEFEERFHMTRKDFNHLPEWKRNDLKFRIGLL